ncbi:MAG: hypothetical protein R3C53_23275 [Pirellulaceae bacterium]
MKLDWDPEIDTPATVAVIGGSPLGVEAALYARFLGYAVELYDTTKIGDDLLAWGDRPILDHRPTATTWRDVTTSLGLAALEAQSSEFEFSDLDSAVTYREYVDQYLLPLARTDLLYDSMHINAPVLSISRLSLSPNDSISIARRAEQEFRLLIDASNRGEYSQLVDIVLDCSSPSNPASGLASGGGLAIGQRVVQQSLTHGKVDILGKQRSRFTDRHTVVFGSNLAAACNAIELAQLAEKCNKTRLTWIVPNRLGSSGWALDLPACASGSCIAEIHLLAQQLLSDGSPHVVPMHAWGIRLIKFEAGIWQLKLQTTEEETLDITADELIHCGGAPHALVRHARACITSY